MSQRPFWVSIIQWTLWALAMAGIMGWLARSRMNKAAPGEESVMIYPRSALVLSVVCAAVGAALTAFSLWASRENAPWWAVAIFATLLFASLHWVVDCLVARYTLSDDGFEYVSVFTGKHFFRWNEVQSLKYAPNMRWFKLEDSQGRVARISVMMTGLPMFARLFMERARNVDIDRAAIPILQQTARGEPPSLWL